jgi:hypothetical protein
MRSLGVFTAGALALAVLAAPAAPASAQSFAYCKADVQRLCPGVPPGGGKIKKCLKAHENEVSLGCAKELKALKGKMGA